MKKVRFPPISDLENWLRTGILIEFTHGIVGAGQLSHRSRIRGRDYPCRAVIAVRPDVRQFVNASEYGSPPPWSTSDLEEKLATIAHELIHLGRGDLGRVAPRDRLLECEIDRVAYEAVQERGMLERFLLEFASRRRSLILEEAPETEFREYLGRLVRAELVRTGLRFGDERSICQLEFMEKIGSAA